MNDIHFICLGAIIFLSSPFFLFSALWRTYLCLWKMYELYNVVLNF